MANGGRIDYSVGFKVDKTGLAEIKKSLQELQKVSLNDMLQNNNYTGTRSDQMKQARSDLAKLQITATEVGKAFENAFNPATGLTNLQKLNASLKEIGMTNISQQFAKGGEAGNQAFYKIAKGALTTNMQLRQTNTLLDKMGQTLGNTIKWGISSSIMNRFVGSVQQAYGYVQHLDTSLNDIRIVTGKSADEMDKFAVKANDAAKSLGQSTTAYTEAALIYYQQGLSDEESQARAETTLKAANVTGQTGREVSEQLTAVWNGYKVSAEETELYVDKLAAVAATTASDLEELSTGMSKVASAANNMGVDIDQLNAQLATIVSVTRQAPESAGTALKTIYARMEDLKIGGEDESGVKLGDVSSTLEAVGISVMDTQGDLRDLGEVIEEVAAKWDTWTGAQQNAIAQALAGKRQYNNLLALFDNWDMYTDALETSRNSVGTLQKQQDIYMESTAAHLQQLKTQWEDFYDSLIDTDDINTVLDGITDLVDVFTRFLDGVGGGRNALLMLGSVGLTVFDKQISAGITHAIQSFSRMKSNAAELEAQLNNIQLFKNTEQYQTYEPVKVLVDSLEEISQYYKILDNEQINQANALAQQAADAKELQLQWEKNTKALQTFQENLDKTRYSGIADKNFDVNNIEHKENRAVALKDYSGIVRDFSEDGETLLENFEALDNEINDEFVQGLDDTIERFDKLKKVGLFDNIEPKKLKSIENSLDGMTKAAKSNNFAGMQLHLNNFKDLIEQVNPDLKELLNNLFKVNEEAGNTKFDAATASLRGFLEQAKLQNTVQGFVDGFAALGQFASGITSLSHTFDILGNSSLTTKEKITQFLSSVGMGISMLLSSAMRLPLLIDSFKELPNVFSSITTAFARWAVQGDKMAIAQRAIVSANEEQKASYAKLINVQSVENVVLDEDKAAIIADTVAKEGNITATEVLSASVRKLWTAFLANPLAWVAAGIAAVTVAAAAVDKHLNKVAKSAADASQREVEAAQKAEEAAKNQLESVKQLIQEYNNLKENYSEQNIEELRQKVYDLCVQYGVQIDMLKLMKADYEELNQLMNDVYNAALHEANQASLDSINAQMQYLVDNAKSIEEEAIGPIEHLLQLFNKLTAFTAPFAQFANGFKQIVGIAKTYKDPEIYSILSEDGKVDWEKFYQASTETQDAIEKELEKRNNSIIGEIKGIADPTVEASLNAIRQNRENRDKREQAIQDTQKSQAEEIYSTTYANLDIKNATDYNKTKEELANQLVIDLHMTEEEAIKFAEEKLASGEHSFTIKSSLSVGEELSSYYNQSAEEIANQYENQSTSVKNFISENIDLAKAYDNVDDFLNDFDDIIDRENENQHLLNVGVALTNADGEELKPEDIEAMFKEQGFEEAIGKTKEEFETQSFDQQLADLSVYYIKANQLENDFQQNKKEGLEEDIKARQANVQSQITELQSIKDTILSNYDSLTEDDLFQGKIDLIDSQLEKAAEKAGEVWDLPDDTFSLLDEYVSALEQGEDELDGLSNKTIDFISALKTQNDLSDEDLVLMRNRKKAYKEYQDAISKSNNGLNEAVKDTKSYSKALAKLNSQYTGLGKTYEKLGKQSIDWDAMKKSTEALKKSTDSTIDSLQGAYSSLTSIMEEYNETQTLSMDNLQALLNMDTAYLSALKIENGQMSLNEDSLKQIALAKLDEAEAEAYAQAMEELHNQTTREGIEGTASAKIALADYGAAATNAAQAARAGAADWKAYWDAALNREGVENDAYAQKVGAALQTKLQAIDAVRNQIMSGQFSTTMKGPDTSSAGGSSSTEKEADHEDYLERETDLYRAINEELDDIESTLGRIQEFDDHSWGLTAKKALEQENKLLKQQLDMLEKKKDTYERDLGARRGALESQGINFSEDGSVMTNAEDKINQLYGEYNAMVDKYNAMSADDQESFKETLEVKKDSIDEIEDAIDKYEDGYNDYNSVLDELLDTHYELIENEVNHFNADIDVHLELDEAEQEWNDFWYEVVKDIEDEDFAGRIAQSVGKLNTLIGTVGKTRDSQVAELTDHLNEVTAEVRAQIAAAARGGEGSLFQDDSALSKENLENYRDQLMDAVRTAKEEIDEMSDTYLEALDHAQDLIDDQVEGWEAIGDHIEHDLELIQMVSGDKAFDALNKQFEQQYKNNLQLIQTQRMSTDYWQERMKYYEQMMATEQEGSEMYKMYSDALETASENYRKAVSDLDKTVEDALKKLEEWRKNQVAEITDSLDKALSKNMGLEDLKQQWDLVVEEQDYYLDNVERAIEMEGLQNEFDDVLNAMDARGAKQQEFLKWQDEELRKLNEKNKLTQYDIDEVKARLELKRQELALEEAQQNKSNLRLRRDSQGNYTYQYVADEGNVEDAEDKMLTAKREWYELVKKRNEETTNEVIDIRKRLLEAENEMAEALAAHNDEAYENAKARYEFLIEYEKELMEEGEKAKRDFYSGTAEFFADVNDNQILPMWDTTIQQMIDKWDNGGKDSFIGATISAIGDLEEVQRQFGNHTEEILYTAGVNYQDLVERGIDPTTEALEDMQDSNEVLNVSLEETNDLMNQLADELSVAIDAYNSLKDAAVNAIREANDALETLARTAIETSQQVQSAIAAANSAASAMANMRAAASSSGSGGGGGGSYGPSSSKSSRQRKKLELVDDPYGVAGTKGIREVGTSNYLEITSDDVVRDSWGYHSQYEELKRRYESQGYIVPFKSGGYTGEWNDTNNGRLALLHQKELVLNESDTTNILNAVKAVRDIVSAQASPNFSGVADSIANMAAMQANAFAQIGSSMLSAIASSVNNNNSDVSNYRNMTINADFSGVRSADAIYQALRELENYGAQQAYSSAPHANSSY